MSIEARQLQETLYSYAAILNFTPLRAKFGACSVQNAQLLSRITTNTKRKYKKTLILVKRFARLFL